MHIYYFVRGATKKTKNDMKYKLGVNVYVGTIFNAYFIISSN